MHEGGKMTALAPDTSQPCSLRCKEDVILRHSTNDAGHHIVVYRMKSLSAPSTIPVKWSPAATLDVVGVLLENNKMNPPACCKNRKVNRMVSQVLPHCPSFYRTQLPRPWMLPLPCRRPKIRANQAPAVPPFPPFRWCSQRWGRTPSFISSSGPPQIRVSHTSSRSTIPSSCQGTSLPTRSWPTDYPPSPLCHF